MPKRTDIKSILIIGAGPIVIGWYEEGKSEALSASQFRPASTPVMAACAAMTGVAKTKKRAQSQQNH